MPNTVITGPILDSLGQPANGYLYGAQTARSVIDGALVTQTVVKARVIDGTPYLPDGLTPLEVPSTAVDSEAFEWVEDFRPYLTQVVRYTDIPDAGPVSYAALSERARPVGSSTWIVPGWARELVDANAGIAASVEHVDAVKADVDTTVTGFGATVTAAQSAIDAAAAEVEAFAGTNNQQVANMATTPGPLKDALNSTYARVVSIEKFRQEGEVLGGPTDANNAAIFQRAVDELNLAYVADGKPRIITVPDGDYWMAAALTWKNGVGLKGQSQTGTVLHAPVNGSCINSGASPTDQRTDNYFETFTIDGSRQYSATYFVGYKGMQFEYPKRLTLKHVTVQNTWATGMAFDNPVDVVLDHPKIINFGRQLSVLGRDPEQTSGCSGIGNGVGEYDVESITIIAPWIDGGTSGLNGLFFERPVYDAIENGGKEGRGISVRGGIAMNCHVGYRESGAIGADVDGLILINNRCNGLRIDSTNLTYRGGERGTYRGTIKGNGTLGVARSAGVWIGAGGDHFTIDGDISNNHGPGVATAPSSLMGGSVLGSGVQIRANVHDNEGDGVLVQSPGSGHSGEVVGFKVLGDVYGNAGTGVKVTVPTDMFTVKGWVGDDKDTPTQTVGLALLGALLTASRLNVTAALMGNTVPLSLQQTLSGNFVPVGTNLTKASSLRIVSAETTVGSRVTLAWTPPFEIAGGGTVTDYVIRFRKVGTTTWSTFTHSASTDATIQVTGLENRAQYEFGVAAVIGGVAPVNSDFSPSVAAVPTTTPRFSDTFLRGTSAGGLGSTDGGSQTPRAWTYLDLKIAGTAVGPNTWGIHSNPQSPPIVQARSNTSIAVNRGATAAVVDVGFANGVHELTLAAFAAPSHPAVGLGFRILDAENYWFVSLRKWGSATAVYALHRITAGGTPFVALDLAVIPKKGDTIQVRDKVTSIEVWINGALAGTYAGSSVSDFATATRAGPVANFTDSVTGFTQWSYAIS